MAHARPTGLIIVFALLAMGGHAASAEESHPFRVAETGRGYDRLQDAVDAIGDRSGTILIRSGNYGQCAVQGAGVVGYRALTPGQVIFDGGVCEGKGTLVLRGRSATVDGIIFQNIGVADGNGAGIRLERGDLSITNAMFRNSEQGILTADDPSGSIIIERSTFSGLGRCDRGLSCAHSIYIGNYGALTVRRSRFEQGTGGHYVKSRAARVTLSDNSFDDTRGRATNYMIDLSNGAVGSIDGNIFVQGRDKENYSCFIAVAPEGRRVSSRGLSVANNSASIAPGIDRQTVFLADWSGDGVVLAANRLGPNLKPYERRK